MCACMMWWKKRKEKKTKKRKKWRKQEKRGGEKTIRSHQNCQKIKQKTKEKIHRKEKQITRAKDKCTTPLGGSSSSFFLSHDRQGGFTLKNRFCFCFVFRTLRETEQFCLLLFFCDFLLGDFFGSLMW